MTAHRDHEAEECVGGTAVGDHDIVARLRLRLMEAARLVVAEKGLDAGAAEIAARAEVGVGTLYRRFGTKEALVIDIVNERARPRILFIIHEAMKRL